MAELIREKYATALFEAAVEENCLDEALAGLEVIKDAFYAAPDYLKLLTAPVIDKEKKCELILELLKDGFPPFVKNFMLIIASNNRFANFFEICTEFFALCDKQKNRVRIKAITALELSTEQTQKLVKKLSASLNKEVLLTNVIDESLLGGIKLQYNNTEVDSSIISSLGELKQQIKEQA